MITKQLRSHTVPAITQEQEVFLCDVCKAEFAWNNDAVAHFGEVHAVKAWRGDDPEFPIWIYVETNFAATAYLNWRYRGYDTERVVYWKEVGWYRVRRTHLDDYHGGPDEQYSLTYISDEIADKLSRVDTLTKQIENLKKLQEARVMDSIERIV